MMRREEDEGADAGDGSDDDGEFIAALRDDGHCVEESAAGGVPVGKTGLLRQRRRTSSAFNRSNGLVLSTTYVTATFGGAPAHYALRLGEKCSSTVVVHLQFMAESGVGKNAAIKVSSDRVVFTPENYKEPQIVRVEVTEQCVGTSMILHRVFSLDKNYDRINTPNLVVKIERTSVGTLLMLGGALVKKRKNAKGEIMEPRLAANRPIDLDKALAAASLAATAAASEDTDGSISVPPAVQPAELSSIYVTHMTAGNNFSVIAAKTHGGPDALFTWGMNTNGELGIGSTTPMNDPVPVAIPTQQYGEQLSVVSVSCGKHHTAVVTNHGRLFTWGNNKYGQLGLGDYTNVDTPREVVFAGALFKLSHQRALRIKHTILEHGATNVTQVACGAFHTLFVTHQQHILSMGYNQAGQLGIGHRLQQHKGWRSCTPVMVEALRDRCVLDLAAGQNHSGCVLSNGEVYVWGCGGDGRLGVPLGARSGEAGVGPSHSDCEVTPVPVLSLEDMGVRARSIRCGSRHTAIISDRDLLYIWGANEFGQLGLGDKRPRLRPCLLQFQPFLKEGVIDVALGEFHSACVTWDGSAFVWGLDLSGEQSTRLDQRCTPERISSPDNEQAIQIACGWSHTALLTQTSRDGASDNLATASHLDGTKHVHIHRRKERALQYYTRQQEVSRWKRVSNALAVMGKPQHRFGGWRRREKKKNRPAKADFAEVVAGAIKRSCGTDIRLNACQQLTKQVIEGVARSFAAQVVADGMHRVVELVPIAVTPIRPQSSSFKRHHRRRGDRPASTPGRTPRQESLRGVFYHNELQHLSPPKIPPPCIAPPSCPSPRRYEVKDGNDGHEGSWVLRSKPSPTQPAYDISCQSMKASSSLASLLSALQDENDGEELRSPQCTTRSPRSRVNKRFGAIEALLHKPSFSILSQVPRRPVRQRQSPREACCRQPN